MAQYRLAQTMEATGSNLKAYELLAAIDTSVLDERERLYVEGARAKYVHKRDIATALETFQELVKRYPFDSEAHQNLAESYWLAREDQRAIDQLKLLVDLHPREASSWMALAEQQIEVGERGDASESLARYSALRPEDAYADALAGNLAFGRGDFAAAREHFNAALEKRSGMGIAELGLARVAYFEGNTEEAFQRWSAMRSGDSIEADYRIDAAFDAAGALQGLGRFAEATEVVQSVSAEIENEGFREALALTVIAVSAMERGDYQAARARLEEAIGKTPASGKPTRQLFFLGMVGHAAGDEELFDDAIARMQALELTEGGWSDGTRDAAIAFLHGIARLDDAPGDALGHLREASEIEGFHYRLYGAWLADALERTGEKEQAAALLESIAAPDLTNPRLDLEIDRARVVAMLR